MCNNDPFLNHWFAGVNDYLENASEKDTAQFLSYSAKACSDSYPLDLYRSAYDKTNSLEDFLKYLATHFEDFDYQILPDCLHLIYKKCSCELYLKQHITSARLCTCSEKSLLYLWGSVFGVDNVQVRLLSSVLRGDAKCVFEVKLKNVEI